MEQAMKLPERLYNYVLRWYWQRQLRNVRTPSGRVLIFADLALGDLCFFLPVIQALKDRPHDVVCNDPDRAEVIKLITPNVKRLDEVTGEYGTAVVSWQQQYKPHIKKLLELDIPTRIGHFNLERDKYAWVFNQKVPCLHNYHRAVVNEWLLWPFGIHHPEPVRLSVDSSGFEFRWDVLIAPYSNNGCGMKNWGGHGAVREALRAGWIDRHWDMQFLIKAISRARLVIGNDSGLVKLADAFGKPTITTFLSTGPATIAQAGTLHGHNLLDPTVDEVERLARKILG
jgi:hypothetical protein